ncbi:MAG: type II toxin-antitoxin system RelE/ParE family toxin [Flavobacteriales bacterium]
MTVEVTLQARRRLFDIWKRIEQSSSSTTADKVVARLLKRARELGGHPRKGPPEPYLAHHGKEHRFLLLGRYKILYHITEETVFVTDFFDTKQHPARMRG